MGALFGKEIAKTHAFLSRHHGHTFTEEDSKEEKAIMTKRNRVFTILGFSNKNTVQSTRGDINIHFRFRLGKTCLL